MYPITEEAYALFLSSSRQTAEIAFNGKAETLTLTEADILSGSLAVNRYCASGNKIEIGSAIASELTLSLNNADGRFDETVFEGAELYVRIGTKDWSDEDAPFHFVPLGYFTVDEPPRRLESISISALDRMVLFDKQANSASLTFPITVGDLLVRICDLCNVTLGTDADSLRNADYIVLSAPDGEITYRQYLSWIAEITGTCAFIDWNGLLILKWYEATNTVLTESERFSSDLLENALEITGIQITEEENVYIAGNEGYVLNIEGNALIQYGQQNIADTLYAALGGFSYLPFSATVKPMPHLYPLDVISFTDKSGSTHTTIITDCTFRLNLNTVLKGKGETAVRDSYAAVNPLTKRESVIIQTIEAEQNKTLNDRIQNVLAFNELISNALGLFVTPVVQADRSTVYYIHDKELLAESSTIFTMTATGLAWTNSGWNDGAPVWSYGVTAAGDALFRLLSAEGIEVNKAGQDYRISITPSTFQIYYQHQLVTNIEADKMTIPKLRVTNTAEFGRIQIVPYVISGSMVGTGIVFLDD